VFGPLFSFTGCLLPVAIHIGIVASVRTASSTDKPENALPGDQATLRIPGSSCEHSPDDLAEIQSSFRKRLSLTTQNPPGAKESVSPTHGPPRKSWDTLTRVKIASNGLTRAIETWQPKPRRARDAEQTGVAPD